MSLALTRVVAVILNDPLTNFPSSIVIVARSYLFVALILSQAQAHSDAVIPK